MKGKEHLNKFPSLTRNRILGPLLVLLLTRAVARADSAEAWGSNSLGELGDGTSIQRWSPVAVSGMASGVIAAGAGNGHSLAIQNGGAWAWGQNYVGELGDGTTTNRLAPVPVTGLTNGTTAISAGYGHSLAIQNGGVLAWGSNNDGQIGDGTTTNHLTPFSVTGLTSGVTAIAAGSAYGLAVKNGGVWAWGANSLGELGDGNSGQGAISAVPVSVTGLTSGVTVIAAGQSHSLAVQNGGAWAWGDNYLGDLGDGTMTMRTTPVPVSGLSSGVTALAAGARHSLAVQNGGVWAWGGNENGEIGDGTTTPRYTPVQVDRADLHDIIAIAAGGYSSYALSSDGSLWVWGANSKGELGLGPTFITRYLTPQHLLPPTGYVFTSINGGDGDSALGTLAPLPATEFRITSIQKVGHDIVLTWTAPGGSTNVVQATIGTNGLGDAPSFADISDSIHIVGSGNVTTTFVDSWGATNQPARFYRIRVQ
jgi:alpha-tubulin suppressor-like RCC1 family protein